MRAALYAGELVRESVDVEAVFALGVREKEGDGKGDEEGRREDLLQAARTGGALIWTRDGQRVEAPALPEHRFVSCFTLHLEDLLAGDADTDADIARRLVREMAGGYDLDAARNECGFSVPPRVGQTEAREVSAAEENLWRQQGRYRELQRDEERLGLLERELLEAQEAEREEDRLERALEILAKRRERVGLERRKEAFPPDMERLSGAEAQALERLHGERRRAEEGLARAEAERRTAERALAATGLAGSSLDEGAAADLRPRIARLEQLEGEIAHERGRAAEEKEVRDRAVRELGGEPGEDIRLGPEAVHAVDQALDAVRQRAAELREIEAELGRLSDLPEAAPDPERIDEARRELLHWLSAPDAPGSPAARTAALLVIGAAGVAAAVAAGLFFPPAAYALLAPAVIALVYVCLLLRRAGAGAGQRREAEQRYHRLGFERPEGWERERVAERLHVLDRELGTARQRVDDLRRRREAERKRENLRAVLEHESGRLADFARPLNFDPEKLDASFDRWLRLTGDYDRADVAVRKGRARLATLEDGSGAERAGITSFLAAHGEDPRAGVPEVETPGAEPSAAEAPREETAGVEAPAAETPRPAPASGIEPPAAKVLGQRLERLAGRVRQRDGAERDLRAAREDLERLSGEIGKRQAETEEGVPGGRPGAPARRRSCAAGSSSWRSGGHSIGSSPRCVSPRTCSTGSSRSAPTCCAWSKRTGEATLQGRRGSLRERAARAPGLSEEIAGIRARVELASRGRELEEARARRQRTGDALHRRFDEALLAEAGAFLLDQVESEHVRTSRPAILRRAEDWFARFTRRQFELAMGAAGGETFRARETATGEWRELSELSSGTRMQLLLAVRVAFAIEAEKGRTPLPLFLDEALTTADPDRFRAVADSLRRLSEEDGRQIFYLTAQPEEGRYWAEAAPAVIDLAASRRAGRAVTIPEEVGLPPAAPEPPASRRPASRGVRGADRRRPGPTLGTPGRPPRLSFPARRSRAPPAPPSRRRRAPRPLGLLARLGRGGAVPLTGRAVRSPPAGRGRTGVDRGVAGGSRPARRPRRARRIRRRHLALHRSPRGACRRGGRRRAPAAARHGHGSGPPLPGPEPATAGGMAPGERLPRRRRPPRRTRPREAGRHGPSPPTGPRPKPRSPWPRSLREAWGPALPPATRGGAPSRTPPPPPGRKGPDRAGAAGRPPASLQLALASQRAFISANWRSDFFQSKGRSAPLAGSNSLRAVAMRSPP